MKEYGFKVKGPEPSRYGDWERKGRVSDFWFLSLIKLINLISCNLLWELIFYALLLYVLCNIKFLLNKFNFL